MLWLHPPPVLPGPVSGRFSKRRFYEQPAGSAQHACPEPVEPARARIIQLQNALFCIDFRHSSFCPSNVNIRLIYQVKATGSDERVVAHAHRAQPEYLMYLIPEGVTSHHRTTTSELPFTWLPPPVLTVPARSAPIPDYWSSKT